MSASEAVRRFFVAGAISGMIVPAGSARAAYAHGAYAHGAYASGVLPSGVVVVGTTVSSHVADDPTCTSKVAIADRASLWGSPLDRIVTVRFADKTLRDALEYAASQAKVELSYSNELLPRDKRVCLALDRVPIGAVLETLLAGTTLRSIIVGATQIVLAPSRSTSELDVGSNTRRASVLDRVVVTGTPDGASQRGSPFALDVIDGATLARQRATSLGEALDVAVPGLWTWANSAGSVSARYGSIRGASSFGVTTPKIYLDGIEVANPLLVTQLDPARVDRVEVIRGPQGAALYGADAISGVINILTRHDGTSTGARALLLSSSAGFSSTAYAPRDAFVQEHSASLRGGSGSRTYGLGVNLATVGAYVPGASEQRVLADADLRVVRARSVFTGTARLSVQRANASTNLLFGGLAPALSASGRLDRSNAVAAPAAPPGADTMQARPPRDTVRFAGDSATGQDMSQYTVGGTLTSMPSLRWTNTVIAGVDGYRLRGFSNAGLPTPAASAYDYATAQGGADRGTLRLRAVGRFDVDSQTSLSLTFAVEQALTREVDNGAPPSAATRFQPTTIAPPASTVLRATWMNNTGVSAQANLAWRDALFVAAGGRVERTTGSTPNAQLSLLPMVGVAYVRDLGTAVLKLRSAYGTGIRPAHSLMRGSTWMARASVGALQPESQSGTEFGGDLLLGRALSLHLTRFDQRASGLIQPVAYSSYVPLGNGRATRSVAYILENVGAIDNHGWELQGGTQIDRLAIAGTFTLTDSRVARVANGYGGDLRVGDRMLDVPARTASLSASWSATRWTVSTGVTRADDWVGYDRLAIGRALASAEPGKEKDVWGARLRDYWTTYGGVTRVRASMTYRLVRDISAQFGGENLLNVQRGSPDNGTVTAGRTLTFGLRTTF